MEELLKSLTRAANAVATYYEKKIGDSPRVVRLCEHGHPAEPVEGETPAPAKVRKPRAPKEEITAAPTPAAGAQAAAASTPAATAGAAVLEPTEEESLKEVRALAKTYVQRFANQVDGIKAFRELIAATTGVARIDDLVHSQRLLVIAKAKAEIAKKDLAAKAPVETAGTAV